MFIGKEKISPTDPFIERNLKDIIQTYGPGRSILSAPLADFEDLSSHIFDWQFLALSPERMGMPVAQQRTGGGVRLTRNGSNIADYLLDLRRQDQTANADLCCIAGVDTLKASKMLKAWVDQGVLEQLTVTAKRYTSYVKPAQPPAQGALLSDEKDN